VGRKIAALLFLLSMALPKTNAISGYFEIRFARFEHAGGEKFNMAYMRHTVHRWEIFQDLTLDQCLQEIKGKLGIL
jgi:hypothetical protein